jgi:hypothetical protein
MLPSLFDNYTPYVGKERCKMLMIFLAFLLCYLWCWKYEVEDFEGTKARKEMNRKIKENRKKFNIDIP